ncbi:PREDICTED: PAX3- and PAX7-binding protein 1 isoform X1 [Rhagoletis zephyria]|uniref:PAX3- and PAX7-binding protein 1 isoform X1 n=1 Tax=Rhagoletis zephyria TaxID=28612 RepID=UPI0008116668|nr:PREDICTED: PAX3- and PAX7-binding protein 1 isoform X1 [Rhagoletis zephyria]
MSLFRKPKKIQRRVFSTLDDEENAADTMEMDIDREQPVQINKKNKDGGSKKSASKVEKVEEQKPKALLSFADDEEDTEVFQVRKSSNSKKIMRMLDRERRRKRKEERQSSQSTAGSSFGVTGGSSTSRQRDRQQSHDRIDNGRSTGGSSNNISYNLGSATTSSNKYKGTTTLATMGGKAVGIASASAAEQCKSKKSDSIQTEIRTDDFVLVVKKSEPDVILNGRAAICAGRNDMSDEDEPEEEEDDPDDKHRFSKPEHLKQMLESGSIPDAAMIHAARKRRQKAREQGDFIPVEEPKEPVKKGSRLAREDVEGDNSDDEERMDMTVATGKKEREERREQFYAVENNDYTDEDSDREMHEWENQQIRKGVTGAQLVSAQHDAVLSRFMIKPTGTNALEYAPEQQSTSTLLEQAYAKSALQKPQQILSGATKTKKEKSKAVSLRTPNEIHDAIQTRLMKLREVNEKHMSDIERIANELKVLKLEELDCTQKAPTAAAKYRFYQELKCYAADLIDCLTEKTPTINELEKRSLHVFSKHQNFLIERRRQDIRDQAKEMAEASKPAGSRRGPESEEQVRRAAEREGRRTRRRCDREKNELLISHLDGMSSDDETSDRYQEQLQSNLEQIHKEAEAIFNDVNDDFYKVELILMKFYAWRKTDMNSYKDAFVSLCLPKILGPLVRFEMLSWSPLLEEYKDIEKMHWYSACMLYAWSEDETETSLRLDVDVSLVPTIIEKIILPKVTDIVNQCWDPLSTTQTLRLIGFINRLGRDFPLKDTSKQLQQLFEKILEKMKLALENDVFIPIFPKQVQEAKTSFFQRQFCSGLKLFRNFLSWQGIVADKPLRELAIGSLLNRYLLLAMRVCTANDAISKAYIIVNTLPTVWLQPESETLQNLQLLITYIKQTLDAFDAKNPLFMQTCDKAKQILQRLHSY